MICTCGGELIVLETRCTEAYQGKTPKDVPVGIVNPDSNPTENIEFKLDWFRDIVKRCVCDKCGKEQDVVVDTIKQDRRFK